MTECEELETELVSMVAHACTRHNPYRDTDPGPVLKAIGPIEESAMRLLAKRGWVLLDNPQIGYTLRGRWLTPEEREEWLAKNHYGKPS